MKIFVTGATGFIGKHLVNYFFSKGYDITVNLFQNECTPFCKEIKTWILSEEQPLIDIDFFKNEKFDGIIHLASLYIKEHEINQVVKLIDSNVRFGSHLIECASQAGIKWLINTGTFWQHYNNSDYSPVNLYAASKQAYESIAKFYIDTNKIDFYTIKLCDTYGPNDTRPKVFNLWKKIAQTGECLKMSKGEQLISITHVYDIVEAFHQLVLQIDNPTISLINGATFAVYAPKMYTLKELASIFERVSEKKLNISWECEYREREVMLPWLNGISVPGWEPKIDLQDGIQMFLNENHTVL